MKYKFTVILLALVVPMLLAMGSTGVADEPEIVEMEGGQAKVTLVEGSAELFRKEPDLRRPMVKGDLLRHGDRVTTGDQTRVELAMPDDSFLRLTKRPPSSCFLWTTMKKPSSGISGCMPHWARPGQKFPAWWEVEEGFRFQPRTPLQVFEEQRSE